jgi:hypothetical protein
MGWEIEGEPMVPEKREEGIPMTLDAAKKAVERAKVDLQVYQEAIKGMKTEAQLLKVEDDESHALSVDLGIRAKKLAKEINTERDKILLAPSEFTKAVKNLAKAFTDILDSIEEITKSKNRSFKVLQDQRKLEAQKKINEETEKLREKVNEEAAAAGVEAVEVLTPVLAKTQKTVRTAAGIAYSSEYWKFECGPVHRNAPDYPGIKTIRVLAYSHSTKESMIEIGMKAGLTGEPLEKFKFALNEVKFELEVDEEGMATIVSVDGKLLPIIPAEFLEPNSKEIRKAVDGGRRNLEGIKIWREDKEVYK